MGVSLRGTELLPLTPPAAASNNTQGCGLVHRAADSYTGLEARLAAHRPTCKWLGLRVRVRVRVRVGVRVRVRVRVSAPADVQVPCRQQEP